MLNIATMQENFKTKSYEIFVAGCKGKCKGCHNPELWDFTIGEPYTKYTTAIREFITQDEDLNIGFKYITILGGDLLDTKNSYDIEIFLNWLSNAFPHLELIVYTHHDIHTALARLENVLDKIAYIKCNPYDCNVTEYKTQYGFEILENQNFYKRGVDYAI